MNSHYLVVARRAGHRCEYCRAPEAANNFQFEVEHIVPTSRGGSNSPGNLALVCRGCNVRKGANQGDSDESTGEWIPLFDPRADRWTDHFEFDSASMAIIGTTPIGRVAIAVLDLNHPLQLAARDVWYRLRIYP